MHINLSDSVILSLSLPLYLYVSIYLRPLHLLALAFYLVRHLCLQTISIVVQTTCPEIFHLNISFEIYLASKILYY